MCKVKEAVLKYSGSKWRSAEWIISSFPAGYEKMTYLEPLYKSEMYESYLSHWYTDSRKSNCEMGKSATETIWMNYEPPSEQLSMEF